MHNSSRMVDHIIYDTKVIHFFKCNFNLGPCALYMLRALRKLNRALVSGDVMMCRLSVAKNRSKGEKG